MEKNCIEKQNLQVLKNQAIERSLLKLQERLVADAGRLGRGGNNEK